MQQDGSSVFSFVLKQRDDLYNCESCFTGHRLLSCHPYPPLLLSSFCIDLYKGNIFQGVIIFIMLLKFQTLLSSRQLSKNLKIKIYKPIILPVVQYGCETWSLTLREECRLRVFENRILKRILGPRRMRMGSGESSTMRNFIVCTVCLI